MHRATSSVDAHAWGGAFATVGVQIPCFWDNDGVAGVFYSVNRAGHVIVAWSEGKPADCATIFRLLHGVFTGFVSALLSILRDPDSKHG